MTSQSVSIKPVIDFDSLSSDAQRYLPVPTTSATGIWGDVARTTADIGQTIASAANTLANFSGPSGAMSVAGDFAGLIQQQIEIQREMQMTSMISNNERSKHETAMAVVRNMRIG